MKKEYTYTNNSNAIDYAAVQAGINVLINGLNHVTASGKNNGNYDANLVNTFINGDSASNLTALEYVAAMENNTIDGLTETDFFATYQPHLLWGTLATFQNDTSLSTLTMTEYQNLHDKCQAANLGYEAQVPGTVSATNSFARKATVEETRIVSSTAGQLQGIVSSWYYTLRNIALIGLLSVLVYIGIRIVISSTASEKAKYKSMIIDWVIAMCLLFFLHYIMAFSVTIVEKITKAVSNLNDGHPKVVYIEDETTYNTVKDMSGIGEQFAGATSERKKYCSMANKLFYGLCKITITVIR